jgi:hypothetical protein
LQTWDDPALAAKMTCVDRDMAKRANRKSDLPSFAPSANATDFEMRLRACGGLAFGIVLILGSLALDAFTGTLYVSLVAVALLLVVMGFVGLISPNVLLSMGHYGGRVPRYYKAIFWGVMCLYGLLVALMFIGLYAAGYRTDVPRPRPQFNLPPLANPRPPIAEVPPGNAPGVKDDSKAMKQRKSYPVSIAVPEHSVFVPRNAKLTPGTRLQACWSGAWNPITTLSENEDGSINVRWDAFEPDFDCSMVRGELILRKDVLKQFGEFPIDLTSVPGAPNDADPEPKPLKSYPVTIAIPMDSQVVPADAKLQPGTRLQACCAGKWNPITVLSENRDGNLTVRWDDYGPRYDCSMIRNELR